MIVNLNSRIADLLGWQKETRKIPTWTYIGERRIQIPMDFTCWKTPDGKEVFSLPDWENTETLAQSLIDDLSTSERLEFGLLFMGIGMLSKSNTPHSVNYCKAWIALKEKQRNESEDNHGSQQ